MNWRTVLLVVLGVLILAGATVAILALSGGRAIGGALAAATRNSADAVFRPDSAGRYPNEPGWVDEG